MGSLDPSHRRHVPRARFGIYRVRFLALGPPSQQTRDGSGRYGILGRLPALLRQASRAVSGAVSYIARSATGLPVASFDSLERARAFRDDRAARGVRVTLHESRT